MPEQPTVAYFSMEIALRSEVPTYSGGLGVLAGDTIRSAADLGVGLVAVTLLYRLGHFHQRLDPKGRQSEEQVEWEFQRFVEPVDARVAVEIESRRVVLRAWRFIVTGTSGARVPVYLLDSDLPENAPQDRRLTDTLYGGDVRYRLCQEVILGIGGVRMLRALGHSNLDRFHLNEGHAALAVLALLEERIGLDLVGDEDLADAFAALRRSCVFTTHTPVPAGHDKHPLDLVRSVLGERRIQRLQRLGQREVLNLTDLALRASVFVNGVAMRHGEVSQGMFPDYPIDSITNGIHPATWASPSFRDLFDHHIPEWRRDALALRDAVGIPLEEIAVAHRLAKQELLKRVNQLSRYRFHPDLLTVGFARRATAYKRATLVFHDVERLAAIAEAVGPLQLVFAGKAHPADAEGKALIRTVFEAAERLRDRVAVTYLPDYGMELAKLLVSGCDLWLNTPVPPLEASGTSGMKAALNGVPSLSVVDGWWVEGHVEGVTGWAIGDDVGLARRDGNHDAEDARALYEKLEYVVLPTFYVRRRSYLQMMRYAIALNASFFNTQRMVLQYLYHAYREPPAEELRG